MLNMTFPLQKRPLTCYFLSWYSLNTNPVSSEAPSTCCFLHAKRL